MAVTFAQKVTDLGFTNRLKALDLATLYLILNHFDAAHQKAYADALVTLGEYAQSKGYLTKDYQPGNLPPMKPEAKPQFPSPTE